MSYLDIVQIIISILLIVAIIIQNQGAGLGDVFGGQGNVYRTKRGAEKKLFIFTIALSVLFFTTAFLNIFLKK